jgi:uncharacterized membrane-anchored protein
MHGTLPALLLFSAAIALGQGNAPDPAFPTVAADQEAAYRNHVLKVLEGVRYREGVQELPGGIAELHLPEGFRYLDPEDSRKVVVDLWGNPPGGATDLLGMILPAGEHLAASNSWTIVLSYSATGHVADEDAGEIDDADLLEQLKLGNRRASAARRAAGFETMELSGWAVAPRYDARQKVLVWAKRFKTDAHAEETLNYDVRVLGRLGVLSLNAISGMNRVADIETASPAIISMLRFNDGHQYSEFDPATDQQAAFSLAGLVLGGAPAPLETVDPGENGAGFFEKSGKLAIFGGVGLLLLSRRLLGSRKSSA